MDTIILQCLCPDTRFSLQVCRCIDVWLLVEAWMIVIFKYHRKYVNSSVSCLSLICSK